MSFHIHAPDPFAVYPIPEHRGYVVFTDGCCRKNRSAKNCEIYTYVYYPPLTVCKAGKGCKK